MVQSCRNSSKRFLDEIVYKSAGQNEELITKADALYKQWLQKCWYIVWDIETFALNQQWQTMANSTQKQICTRCGGHRQIAKCILNEMWKIDNTHVKVSSWAQDVAYETTDDERKGGQV